MDRLARDLIYHKAFQKWGYTNQKIVAIEELCEAAHALARHLNNKNLPEAVITELADAEIVLEQMKIIFGRRRVLQEKNKKLRRLSEKVGLAKK